MADLTERMTRLLARRAVVSHMVGGFTKTAAPPAAMNQALLGAALGGLGGMAVGMTGKKRRFGMLAPALTGAVLGGIGYPAVSQLASGLSSASQAPEAPAAIAERIKAHRESQHQGLQANGGEGTSGLLRELPDAVSGPVLDLVTGKRAVPLQEGEHSALGSTYNVVGAAAQWPLQNIKNPLTAAAGAGGLMTGMYLGSNPSQAAQVAAGFPKVYSFKDGIPTAPPPKFVSPTGAEVPGHPWNGKNPLREAYDLAENIRSTRQNMNPLTTPWYDLVQGARLQRLRAGDQRVNEYLGNLQSEGKAALQAESAWKTPGQKVRQMATRGALGGVLSSWLMNTLLNSGRME